MSVDMTEVRQLFFEESFENLDTMESNLLDLEVGETNQELINNIFRAAHSIKASGEFCSYRRNVIGRDA
jgi:two-component system chemotaxis sensor kinase CheA